MEFRKEISVNGSDIKLGSNCELEVLPRSVSESSEFKFTLNVEESQAPPNHVRASVTLKCDPPIKLRKSAHLKLPTWFSTKKDVDVTIFTKLPDMTWKELDSTALTDEKFIDVQVKELSNITAFLPKMYLSDVNLRVKPYLYYNATGSFKVGSMPSDDVVENILTSEMKSRRHTAIIKEVKELTVSVGDEIRYTLGGQKVKGKVLVDEAFLQEFMGQVATYEVGAIPPQSSLVLQHMTAVGDRRDDENYPIIFNVAGGADGRRQATVDFCGSFEADNVLTSVGDVYINQTTTVEGTNGPPTRHRRNDISFERLEEIGATRIPAAHSQASPVFTMHAGGNGVHTSNIRFRGDVRVKNMIGNAGNVTIDQRKIYKKPNTGSGTGENDFTPTKTAVQVETDLGEQGARSTLNGEHFDINISVENDAEGMVGSRRTFASTPPTTEETTNNQLNNAM